jgi:hypothetical protein
MVICHYPSFPYKYLYTKRKVDKRDTDAYRHAFCVETTSVLFECLTINTYNKYMNRNCGDQGQGEERPKYAEDSCESVNTDAR